MQPNHYDNNTNIGAGIQLAINELTSSRARSDAQQVIVLMSDGAHTTGPDPVTVAQHAVDLGIPMYTVSVGYIADRDLMIELADMTGGREFYAAGTPAEYTAKLREIFRIIGGLGNALLIE
jgi:Ca-activated chloride channel family protein